MSSNTIQLELKENTQSYFFGKNVYLNRKDSTVEIDLEDTELSVQTLKQIYFYGSYRDLFKISIEDLEKVHKKIMNYSLAPVDPDSPKSHTV